MRKVISFMNFDKQNLKEGDLKLAKNEAGV